MLRSHHDIKKCVCVKENFALTELATNSSLINSLTFTFYSNTWIFLTPRGTGKQFGFKSIKQIFGKHLKGLDSSSLRTEKTKLSDSVEIGLSRVLSTYAHLNTHNRSSITFHWLPHGKQHHISAPSRLRMFILHFTEEHWTLGIVTPLSILSGIIAWTIITDTYCEVALLMFKGLVLGQPNKKKDLGAWQEFALYRLIWFGLYYSCT